ncbi:MAG: hypothetical protein KA066_00750 [Candidatus Pacebacteria bacterium]|nr:hypothetical protein [Candidatus Paceibacterota bacterium]
MTTFKNTMVGAGVALIALVSLALPVGQVYAADLGDGYSYDYSYPMDSGSSYDYSYPMDSGYSYDYSYPMDSGYSYDYSYPVDSGYSYDYSYPVDSGYSYDYSYPVGGSSYSAPTFGGSSGGFSYPSFGGSAPRASTPIYTSAANQQYRQYVAPQLPTFVQPNVANTCTAVNSCNTDNSYTDNSVYAPDNSYTYTNTVTDNSVYSAPTTVTAPTTISYGPVTTSHDSHNQQISYPQPQYQAPIFPQPQYQYQAQYQQPVYQPQRPVSYNTTPYITLSQAPYTGLDLGPVGEAMYWAFLVLWCLGAAYLIVVKRVQNKLVASLNTFLFGSSAKAAAHTTHAPQAHASVSATLVEEGIDPFIQSQIKRA